MNVMAWRDVLFSLLFSWFVLGLVCWIVVLFLVSWDDSTLFSGLKPGNEEVVPLYVDSISMLEPVMDVALRPGRLCGNFISRLRLKP